MGISFILLHKEPCRPIASSDTLTTILAVIIAVLVCLLIMLILSSILFAIKLRKGELLSVHILLIIMNSFRSYIKYNYYVTLVYYIYEVHTYMRSCCAPEYCQLDECV